MVGDCRKVAPYLLLFSLWRARYRYLWLRGDGVTAAAAAAARAARCSWPPPPTRCSSSASRDMGTLSAVEPQHSGTALAFSSATFPVLDGPLFTRIWHQLLPLSAYIKLQITAVHRLALGFGMAAGYAAIDDSGGRGHRRAAPDRLCARTQAAQPAGGRHATLQRPPANLMAVLCATATRS